jgi:prolyl-tRNA editing enzyme YbaK/EbsC (Cys-tRNA(Pro) deacylase)
MSTTPLPASLLKARLDEQEIPYTFIPHRRTTSAAEEARALHLAPWRVAKTIVLATDDGLVRAVLPGSERIDLAKVRRVLCVPHVRLATENELAHAYPAAELGAVPPLGFGDSDTVLVDIRVCGSDEVAIEAGTHDASLRLRTSDLIELADAQIVDICHE